jgi:hypothetical protein
MTHDRIFLVVWLVGAVLIVLVFALTRTLPLHTKASIRALVIAVVFIPGIIFIGHGFFPLPALFVLVLSPFSPANRWITALLFGALPIAVVWAAFRLWLLRQPD